MSRHASSKAAYKNGKPASISPLMLALSSYIALAGKKRLPASVTEITKHHLLDTLASIISGSRLQAGEVTVAYLKKQPRVDEACVPGTRIVTTAALAAFGSGMFAHADETDDSHQQSLTHPGCGVVPAALATAERTRSSGTALLVRRPSDTTFARARQCRSAHTGFRTPGMLHTVSARCSEHVRQRLLSQDLLHIRSVT